jgi:hypothetical protein
MMLARLLPDFGPAREHPAFRRLLAGSLLSGLGNVESGTVAALTTPVVSAVSGGLGCLAIAG